MPEFFEKKAQAIRLIIASKMGKLVIEFRLRFKDFLQWMLPLVSN
jgi:hypothetical protein